MKNIFKNSTGFTLIEVVVSIFVLVMGTLAVMGVISNSLGLVNLSKRSAVATNLTQEGIEVVRNIRDTNWIEEDPYDDELGPGTYCVDYDSTSVNSCADQRLYWDGATYSHNPLGDPTVFSRTVVLSPGTDLEEVDYIDVRVTVSWDGREIVTQTHLYDWR